MCNESLKLYNSPCCLLHNMVYSVQFISSKVKKTVKLAADGRPPELIMIRA